MPPTESALPDAAIDWANTALGAIVVRVTMMAGGLDAMTAGLTYDDGRQAVLRLVRPKRVEHQPVTRDINMLVALAETGLPVAEIMASDPHGLTAGAPALLMTWLPGNHQGYLDDPVRRGLQVCEAVSVVHTVPTPGGIRASTGQRLDGDAWAGLASERLGLAAWSEMRRLRPPLDRPRVLTHGDCWYGNLLWHNGQLSGLVDWSDAELADPATDFALVRLDVALLTEGAANMLPAAEPQPFWDLWVAAIYLAMCSEWHPAAAAIGWPMTEEELRNSLRARLATVLDDSYCA